MTEFNKNHLGGKNELKNWSQDKLASDPSGLDLYEGRMWYNTTELSLKFYDGTDIRIVSTGSSYNIFGTMKFSSSTATADPGSGKVAFNNSDPSLVTEVYIDNISDSGLDIQTYLETLKADDVLYIQQENDSSKFLLCTLDSDIVDNTGWFTATVTPDAFGTILTNDKLTHVGIFKVGGSGGSSSPTTTKGDLIVRNATLDVRLPVGNDGEKIVANSLVPEGIEWVADGVAYSYFPIWAEESSALGANAYEWAYGNGDDTPVGSGIMIGIDCELVTLGLENENGVSTFIQGLKNGVQVGVSDLVVAGKVVTDLPIPVAFLKGDYFNFRTGTPIGSGGTSGRAVAWFRVEIEGVKGIKGDTGDTGGSPIQILSGFTTIIDLGEPDGNWYMASASLENTFTLINTGVNFGTARVRIDTTGKIAFPTVTGATLFDDIEFVIGIEYDLWVENDTLGINYFFRKRL